MVTHHDSPLGRRGRIRHPRIRQEIPILIPPNSPLFLHARFITIWTSLLSVTMPGSILKNRCGFKAIGIISIFFMLFFSTLPNSIKDVNATYEFPNYTEQNLLNDNPSVLPSQSSMEMWSGDSQLCNCIK